MTLLAIRPFEKLFDAMVEINGVKAANPFHRVSISRIQGTWYVRVYK